MLGNARARWAPCRSARWDPLIIPVRTPEMCQPRSETFSIQQGFNAWDKAGSHSAPQHSLPTEIPQEFRLPRNSLPDSPSLVSHPNPWRGEFTTQQHHKAASPGCSDQVTREKLPEPSWQEQHCTITKLIQHFYSAAFQEHLGTFRKLLVPARINGSSKYTLEAER